MLRLAADKDPLKIEPEAGDLADRVSMVTSRLQKGTFTSQSDHEMVTKLYVDYVKRIASQLQATLALACAEDTRLTLPAVPSVSEPVADLLKLVDGQLLLQLSDAASRCAGGEGASPLHAEQGGLQPYKLLVARDAGLLLDSCSQVVLPWRPLAEGWAAPFLLKVEQINKAKCGLLYDCIKQSQGYYDCPVDPKCRSAMNVPFTIPGHEDLEKVFVQEAEAAGLINLKGHRSVGGMRASIYNAMPMQGVEKLVAFMKDFQAKH